MHSSHGRRLANKVKVPATHSGRRLANKGMANGRNLILPW